MENVKWKDVVEMMRELDSYIDEIKALDLSQDKVPVYEALEIFDSEIINKKIPYAITKRVKEKEIDSDRIPYFNAICEHMYPKKDIIAVAGTIKPTTTDGDYCMECQICKDKVNTAFYDKRKLTEVTSPFINAVSQAKFIATRINADASVRKYLMILYLMIENFHAVYEDMMTDLGGIENQTGTLIRS